MFAAIRMWWRCLFGHQIEITFEGWTTAEGYCIDCGKRLVRWHGVWM